MSQCQIPQKLDTTDAAIPLINQCNLIRASLVGSLLILGSIGVEKSVRTPLKVLALLVGSTVGSSRGTTHIICLRGSSKLDRCNPHVDIND